MPPMPGKFGPDPDFCFDCGAFTREDCGLNCRCNQCNGPTEADIKTAAILDDPSRLKVAFEGAAIETNLERWWNEW